MFKLKPDKQVRSYELTVLTPGDFTSTELKKVTDAISSLVKKLGGEVVETKDWGKKELAYAIKKQGKQFKDAVYTFFVLKLDAEKAPELDKQILLNADIIRHLLVVADEKTPTKLGEAQEVKKRNS